VYFSEIKWFREHFEATTYTIIHTESHVCVLSCTINLHVMKCIQQSNQLYQSPQNIIPKRTHFNCNMPYIMWHALYSTKGTAYRIFCDASLILLKYFSIRRTTKTSNLCLFLYHRVSKTFYVCFCLFCRRKESPHDVTKSSPKSFTLVTVTFFLPPTPVEEDSMLHLQWQDTQNALSLN